jgi:GTP-binding protein EngB required for normal cell division
VTAGWDPRLGTIVRQVKTMADGRGREDLIGALDWRLEALAADRPLTLIVAGRTNSGKSTLVNALLGRAAVPAGAHVATTTAAAVDYASGAIKLRIVDTPGVDSSGDSERARAAEQVLGADVIIFMLDPVAPLSRPEARFLEEAAATIADAILVIAKADLLPEGSIMASQRALLARLATRLADAPMFEVSALEKVHADAHHDADLGADSGIPQLARHIAERLAPHHGVVRSAAVVQACRSVLRELEHDDQALLAGDDRLAALAEAAVADHRAYVEATSPEWTAAFGREYQRRTRQVVERDLRLRLLERREQREIRIKSGAVALEEVSAQAKDDLVALATTMQQALVEHVAALISEWTARLELTAVHLPALAFPSVSEIVTPALEIGRHSWPGREKAQGIAGLTNLARSAASGRSFAGLLPGGLAMGTGVGLVMTGLSWSTTEWLRHKVQDQQGALTLVQSAFARAQIELETALREHALELQPVAETALQKSIDTRRHELALEAARLQREAEQAAVNREEARTLAGARLGQVHDLARGLDALTERFTGFLRTGTVPPK